ncbi:MAG: hypothetical protein EBU01_10100 [Crocinitomicaceae bacterium]|nr:hypothetical protein [Crocinitomicaceae bacterium]
MLVISMDAMMIASYIGLSATGVYTTMIYLTSALMVPYRSIIRVSSTFVAKHWKERNLIALQELYQKSSSVGLLIGLLGFLVIFVPIHELFTFIKDYKSGIYVFVILMVGRILDMYSGLNGTIFSTSRKFKYDLYFTILLCVMVFTMNLWLIPKFGINGAAISTSFAYVAYNVLRCYYVYHLFRLQPFNWSQFKLIALFFAFLGLVEVLEYFQVFEDMNVIHTIVLKEILVFSGFIFPVYFFNLEPEIISYSKSMYQKLKGIIRKSKN